MEHALLGPFTVEEWLELPSTKEGVHLELIFGHLHETPPPSGLHQYVATHLAMTAEEALRRANRTDLGALMSVNVRISTGLRTALSPDVVVLGPPSPD